MQNPWHFFLPQEKVFFSMFVKQSLHITEAAKELKFLVDNYSKLSKEQVAEKAKDITAIESKCDYATKEVIEKLFRTFVTPIDREDIYELTVLLDDLTDMIDEAASKVAAYNLDAIPECMNHQTELIWQVVSEVEKAIANLNKLKDANYNCIKIHEIEGKGDAVFSKAIAELFSNGSSPIDVIKFKDLYESFESVLDSAEEISNIVGNIVIKHA
ncbi:MAG: DUF47 family protein [Candidatus Woesearchaeota archaeon]